tara:strand:+ start:94 stop:546 length:453 start_codon:yes stop_codon:yes gene_type:complete
MEFRFRCPKCSSSSIYAERDPKISWEKDRILRCYTCGWSLYGRDKAEAAAKAQYAVFLKEKKAEQIRVAEAARMKEVAAINRWESSHKEQQQAHIDRGLCASIDCAEKDGRPALAKGKSIYCSRKCCVKNAHRRERERKGRKKNQAAQAA